MKNCLLALLIMAHTAFADTPVQDNDRGLNQAPQVVLMATGLQGSEVPASAGEHPTELVDPLW